MQGYFVWSAAVVDGVRGVNAGLERALDEVFATKFVMEGKEYPAIPPGDRAQLLQDYLDLIEEAGKRETD